MNNATHRILAAGLAAALLATGAVSRAADPPKPTPAAGAKTLEDLLKAAKVEYVKVGDAAFKVAIEDNEGNSTNILVEAREIDLGAPKAYAYVWTIVLHLDGDKVPEAILAKLNQYNNGLKFGNVSMEKDKDGGNTIYFNLSFFLKGADAEEMIDFLRMSYIFRQVVRKEMQRIIEEGGDK